MVSLARRFSDYCEFRIQHDIYTQVPDYIQQKISEGGGAQGAMGAWRTAKDECDVLAERLITVRPVVIDFFLDWNASLRDIGRLLIAAAIFECEASYAHGHTPKAAPNSSNDWYRFVIHKLVYGCKGPDDLFENKVQFITFNYDASLEFHLHRALSTIDLLKGANLHKFLGGERVVHVYGSVHAGVPPGPWTINPGVIEVFGKPTDRSRPTTLQLEERKIFLDQCWEAAKNLRTVDQQEKELDVDALQRACAWVKQAQVIYLLGYGFDENNSRRIGLAPVGDHGVRKLIMFTNMGNRATINRRASTLLFGHSQQFLDAAFLATRGKDSTSSEARERFTKHSISILMLLKLRTDLPPFTDTPMWAVYAATAWRCRVSISTSQKTRLRSTMCQKQSQSRLA